MFKVFNLSKNKSKTKNNKKKAMRISKINKKNKIKGG